MLNFYSLLLFVCFNLPVGTPEERKVATQFRGTLLKSGFGMKPWSIYSKYFLNRSQAEASADNIGHLVPSMGKESMMFITDKQFALVRNYSGGALDELEKNQTNWPSFD
tara:strand:+ start:56 stop:382 length:327 start_codon:yes stop_codon:yes gene_type:complete